MEKSKTRRKALMIELRTSTLEVPGVAVTFPSDHGGFPGAEYGQTGDAEAFAAKLREVLDT